jgi:signal transduction histidine kinase
MRLLRWLVDAFRSRAEASLGWGLARAQLLVLTGILAAALLPFVLRFTGSAHVRALLPPGAGLREGVALGLVIGLLPKLWISGAVLGVSLAILLPPLLLLSRRVTRGTVRRLEGLMEQAAAIRDGRTFAPRPVEGRDEVARLQAHLNEMAARLESALGDLGSERDRVAALLESRRRLLVNVSHEVRTPLTALKVQVESLEGAEALRREVERLEALLEDLFTLARADVGRLEVASEPFDVAPVLSGVAETFRPLLWQQARLELVTQLPAGLPRARGDAGRLAQVAGNLLHNALRHAAPGGIVALSARAAADGIVVEVRDTGPGVAAEDLSRLFERFFHGGEGSGTGLGLAIVKELVEAMGGRVEAESPPGEGTTFRLTLPS